MVWGFVHAQEYTHAHAHIMLWFGNGNYRFIVSNCPQHSHPPAMNSEASERVPYEFCILKRFSFWSGWEAVVILSLMFSQSNTPTHTSIQSMGERQSQCQWVCYCLWLDIGRTRTHTHSYGHISQLVRWDQLKHMGHNSYYHKYTTSACKAHRLWTARNPGGYRLLSPWVGFVVNTLGLIISVVFFDAWLLC